MDDDGVFQNRVIIDLVFDNGIDVPGDDFAQDPCNRVTEDRWGVINCIMKDAVFQVDRSFKTGWSAAFNGTIDITADIDDHGRSLQPIKTFLIDLI